MQKRTKIVATIGPASESEETLTAMINAGMNVARFNTKHNEPEWHHERMRRVRTIAEKLGVAVANLIDLQGPEIRSEIAGGKDSFPVEPGDTVYFTTDDTRAGGQEKTILVPLEMLTAVKVGDKILIEDGVGEFVVSFTDGTVVQAKVSQSFIVKKRKTLNLPGVDINLPSLIDTDYVHIDAARNELVDYFALSFVRNANDIEILRTELKKRGLRAGIVAKIENQSAINHLDSIIAAADAVMVARGDLGVEVPFQELAHWQKVIIQKSREQGKPVITATQMLKSMTDAPLPSRAEVTDVSNAVYDGTDAVMLSEETTIGKYPVKVVETQASIVSYTEQFATPAEITMDDDDPASYITHAAMAVLFDQATSKKSTITKVVCLTETGTTARYLARFRQRPTIHALTHDVQTYNKLALYYGVEPYLADFISPELLHTEIIQKIIELKIAKKGETVMIIHGTYWKNPGATNTLKVVEI